MTDTGSLDLAAATAVRTRLYEAQFPYNGTAADKLHFLLRYAILAPSGHNTQPWKFRIHGGTLEMFADFSRAMRETDPENRELMISCGAALLNLRVGIRNFGFTAQIDICP